MRWKKNRRGGHLDLVHGVTGKGKREKGVLRHKFLDTVKELAKGNSENGNDDGVFMDVMKGYRHLQLNLSMRKWFFFK